MILIDVNVLVYAHREDASEHSRYRDWLQGVLGSDMSYAISELVLSGFVRVVTHPGVFSPPSTLRDALAFSDAVRNQPNCMVIGPGRRHWDIFTRLCLEADVRGNLVPDAYFAALAIESGSEWVTTDRDFARFPGLRWHHPLSSAA